MIFERQEYQQECIEHIMTLLENFDFKEPSTSNLKECFMEFYSNHSLPIKALSDKFNVDILMETGTGKTFTYLNLIFELHRKYKQNKFIIFVPRKAILESIKQNIELTKDYFYNEFKKHLKSYFYSDSKSQSSIINHYIKNTDELSVLILTNSAIDKEKNILNQSSEALFNFKSIFENIIALKPISIIDEPHLLKGEAFHQYFSKIQNLYFRFGATFPDKTHSLSNLVYCLDSIQAFNQYLVKQVSVHTLFEDNLEPKLIKIEAKNKKALFSYHLDNIGYIKEVSCKEDLGQALNYPSYNGVEILNFKGQKAFLSNGSFLEIHKQSYTLNQSQISHLLSTSLDLHFKKERRLFSQGIKALSLYFIPNISDFRGEEAWIKKEFERLYKQKREQILKENLNEDYRNYLLRDFDSEGQLRVCEGYFSGDKGSNDEKEAQGVKLILEAKEKLLSFDTPLRFIFSVWALQEGWDNPNIFTLTKLASSSSETSRHQQIGRGLRLCVNKEGKRITQKFLGYKEEEFYQINKLDVILNGAEAGFVEALQKEILQSSFSFNGKTLSHENLESLGLNKRQASRMLSLLEDFKALEFDEENNNYKIIAPIEEALKSHQEFKDLLKEKFNEVLNSFSPTTNRHEQVSNANIKKDRIKIRLNKAKEFKELWQNINHKALLTYKDIDTQGLIGAIKARFDSLELPKSKISMQSQTQTEAAQFTLTQEQRLKEYDFSSEHFTKTIATNLIEFANKHKFPLNFILKIYNVCDKQNFKNNPESALKHLQEFIQEELHKSMISSVNYQFIKTEASNEDLLFDSKGEPKEWIESYKLGHFIDKEASVLENYLYEKAVYDSKLEKEVITQDPTKINNTTIKVFAKLPKLSIPTPYKNYEPDFAYLLENEEGKKMFFICETKGYEKESDMRTQEAFKIQYAKKFFEALQEHLKDKVRIVYSSRLSTQTLSDILNKILQEEK